MPCDLMLIFIFKGNAKLESEGNKNKYVIFFFIQIHSACESLGLVDTGEESPFPSPM